VDVPPVPLMVLDGLADGIENVESLRDHGEVAPDGLALVDELEVIGALRNLLDEGLVEAWELAEPERKLVPADAPSSDDASLRRYWFRWTADGARTWREGSRILDAYWDAHPPGG
jgi:hypothetical protein